MARKQRVLIIDDDSSLRQLIGRILERGKYEVLMAENGIQGLNMASEKRPDLVLIDVMMPLIDGLEVCRRLRATASTRHLPIIMLSALGDVDDKVNGFKAGADDYVGKPVDPRELLARVRALLQRARYSRPVQTRTIAFVGAKGGVGTTTTALNVAVILAKQGKSVMLAELRRHGGTVRYHLKLQASQDVGGLLELDPDHIKRPEVERRVLQHNTGLQLLLASESIIDRPMTARHVEKILDVLMQKAEYVILDLAAPTNEGVRRALELSDQILLVTEPESLSLACGRMRLDKMREWGMFDRVDLVMVSRAPSATMYNRVEVENQLGMGGRENRLAAHWETRALEVDVRLRQGVAGVVPAAPELFHESVREGVPLVLIEPSAQAARALVDLADWLRAKDGDLPEPEAPVRYVS